MFSRGPLRLTHLGWGLAVPVLFLSLLGLATIHATERKDAARVTSGDAPSESNWIVSTAETIGVLTLKQGVYLALGVGLLLLTLRVSYQKIGEFAFLIYGFVLLLLAVLVVARWVDLPFVPVRRDVRRWIQFGVSFATIQPSEFMKPALILALARYLRYRESFRSWPGLVPPFLFAMVPMALILFQPDLGTMLMLLPVLFAMLFVAGARLRHLILIVVLGLATLPAFYFYGMADYQRSRIDVVFKQSIDDEKWHMGPGYQLRQSKIALGTGGLAGEGYAEGAFIEYELLPDEHNDFIFAIIGHQWGLLGCVLILLAYSVIVMCGLEVATVTNDPFGRLLAVGVVVMIVVQALLNVGMTLGLTPITGMTLPFVSAGGSSLWGNFIALGLLVNVAQRRPMLIANPPFEFDRDD